jgi:hypothetical protein
MMFTWGLSLKGRCSLLLLKAKRKCSYFILFLISVVLELDSGIIYVKPD